MLDNKLKPKRSFDLLRIGKKNDGGYLVEKNSYKNSEFLIGVGINDDWSFEKNFKKNFIGIDNQISSKFLVKIFFIKFFRFFYTFCLIDILNSFFKIIEFNFIKHNFLKLTLSNYTDLSKGIVSLDWVLQSYCLGCNKIFLKIDIEGSEYRILDDIILIQDKICGLVIEMHDIDINIGKIIKFIDEIDMDLTHIHGNNFAGLDSNSDPLVIELTFSKNPKEISGPVILPNTLDYPNDKNKPELNLNFKK
jgi:hypothetical protein